MRDKSVDHVRRAFAHTHDVVHLHALARRRRQTFKRLAAHLLGVADDVVDLRHVREALGFDLRCAARDDDASFRLVAAKFSYRLCGLAHGLTGHSTGIDDDRVLNPGGLRVTPHDLELKRVEPAA